jgi:hypothetical protein
MICAFAIHRKECAPITSDYWFTDVKQTNRVKLAQWDSGGEHCKDYKTAKNTPDAVAPNLNTFQTFLRFILELKTLTN